MADNPKQKNQRKPKKEDNTKAKTKAKAESNEEEKTVYITSKINEAFAVSEVIQYFTNNLANSIELTISFPLKPEIQLTKFIITIGNKTVISKILPKEKAEEKYTDAISSGNTAFLSTFDQSYSNYTINVGNVLPKEKVKLTSIFNQMITSQDMSYEFSFMEHYPCFIYQGKKVESKKIKGNFVLKTNSKITRLITPFMDETAKKSISYKVTFNEDYTQATIEFNKKIETENIKSLNKLKPKPIRPVRPLPPAFMRDRRGLILQQIHGNAINNSFPGLKNRFTL